MSNLLEVKVPDIGDFRDVPVIEVLVKEGDRVAPEDSLVTLESDKATLDVPSPAAGTVSALRVKPGDRVSEGSVIVVLETDAAPAMAQATPGAAPPPSAPPTPPAAPAAATPVSISSATTPPPAEVKASAPAAPTPAAAPVAAPAAPDPSEFRKAHASPSVRKFARELGVDLARVTGTGPKGRILEADVVAFVKATLSAPRAASTGAAAGGGLDLLPWPNIDFSQFGPIEEMPLSRIRRIAGANLARNWVMIPHVTQFDEADVTDLEAFRLALNSEKEASGIKVTMLAFLVRACVAALRQFPDFNASLAGDRLVYKRYFHIGFAADTPHGLVVPVIRDADRKGVREIAEETAALSAKAREGRLAPADMQGGCFTISSLGGIGGTAFTPIINAPEVAILGVSKIAMRPSWDGKAFVPRLMLPLSLSYDHRVIDGAGAARFTTHLAKLLADMRRSLL